MDSGKTTQTKIIILQYFSFK